MLIISGNFSLFSERQPSKKIYFKYIYIFPPPSLSMFNFETFRELNHTEIGVQYKYNPDRLIAELQRSKLLVVNPFCHCEQQMNPGQLSRLIDNRKG